MYGQLSLKVTFKSCEGSPIASNFHEFWTDELHLWEITQKKESLMFECYNFVDPMEWRAVTIWGWYPTMKL
jgi:hypothetical protein